MKMWIEGEISKLNLENMSHIISEKMLTDIYDYFSKERMLSIPLLQRKFKISSTEAQRIIKHIVDSINFQDHEIKQKMNKKCRRETLYIVAIRGECPDDTITESKGFWIYFERGDSSTLWRGVG